MRAVLARSTADLSSRESRRDSGQRREAPEGRLCRVSVLALPSLVISREWGMSRSPVPVVSDSDRKVLESWVRSTSVPAGLARRARIVLLASEGIGTNEIVDKVGSTRPTVIGWRNRYIDRGFGRLGRSAEERPGTGDRSDRGDQRDAGAAAGAARSDALVEPAAGRPVGDLESPRWPRSGASGACKPGGSETFKFSTDPRAGGQDPRRRRAVPGPAGEGRGALDRRENARSRPWTGPRRSCRCDPGCPREADARLRPARHHHTVRRAGGRHRQGHRRLLPRHRHEEFLRFLKQVAKAYPRVQLHMVVDNYATHKHPTVKAWLARNPRITMHFTPTVRVLAEHGRDLLRHHHPPSHPPRHFTSVTDLIAAITFIDGWNERCQPFTWTKTADDIIQHATRSKPTQFTRH